MKKIDIKAFGIGEQIWFNIGRLKRVEEMLKKPIGTILQESDNISLSNIIVFLQVGMSQNGAKSAQYYEEKIDRALEDGFSIIDIQHCILLAIAGSGLMGKEFYYQFFPEERNAIADAEINEEKNV